MFICIKIIILSLSPLPQRWLKQHREEKEKASDGSVTMESGGRPKAPPTAGDEHDKENLHMSTPGTCTCMPIVHVSIYMYMYLYKLYVHV